MTAPGLQPWDHVRYRIPAWGNSQYDGGKWLSEVIKNKRNADYKMFALLK